LLGGAGGGVTENYSLACDIDLAGYTDSAGDPITWQGPSGYGGHFYGNGYTISGLELNSGDASQAIKKMALFQSLGDGAVLENFNLEVSTPNNQPITLDGTIYFGGVLATVNDPVTITIRKVGVKGELKIAEKKNTYGGGRAMLIGGFFGEASRFREIHIEECYSAVNITLSSVTDNSVCVAGGFLARQWQGNYDSTQYSPGVFNFVNCYSSGNITGTVSGTASFTAGGFIGDMRCKTGSGITNVTIDNCYTSGNIQVNAPAQNSRIAGFAAYVFNNEDMLNVTIKNSAAINTDISLNPSNDAFAKRFASHDAPTAEHFAITLQNNIANNAMLINNAVYTDDSNDLTGTTVQGKGVPPDGLKVPATWTTAAPGGLGWDPAIWDFDGLSKSGSAFYWPRLR
jgi:hypothetical protein